MASCQVPSLLGRCRWLIMGQVQGVGFRPFIYRLANSLGLAGFVRNTPQGVVIECQGDLTQLEKFELELRRNHPPLARIHHVDRQLLPPEEHVGGFHIEHSFDSQSDLLLGQVTVDTAVCPDCLREIFSPTDRRFRYGLTNCTNCGPRFSIIRRIPYDRVNTTMAGFTMCSACRCEYTNPADRRFHAQPIACHDCGPQVAIVDCRGQKIVGDPIDQARRLLLEGKIVAVKGLGGFHLAVKADDEQAVQRLRRLKKRDSKPFALMVGSIEKARRIVELSHTAEQLMLSPQCPIVLAIRHGDSEIAPSVAPGNHRLGVMLPYTPIHHLLLKDLPDTVFVMTSGNISDEPLAIDNDEALERLGPMCDAILWHDRPIQRGVDDSVVIDMHQDAPIFVRRARGYVPEAIDLPAAVQSDTQGLCLGGELKNTIAVVRAGQAILSHHLGDLSHLAAFEAFVRTIEDMQHLFGITPEWIAHDLHPMYLSTAQARKLADERHLPLIGVQHHHAHAAALLAEHRVSERILVVVCDGTGWGPDGTIWGGELLAADLSGFERIAHLKPLRLAGGDAAARETARCGLALLYQAFGAGFEDHPAARRLVPDASRRQVLCRMIRDNINCALSSGAGRVFDGVAALLGLCSYNHFEAQAALAMEAAAHRAGKQKSRDGLFEIRDGLISLSPLVRELLRLVEAGSSAEDLSWLFHEQFARALGQAATEAADRLGLRVVGLSGGVFCNAWLTRRLTELLVSAGLEVLRHRLVPPNDGGLSLGQAAVAAARISGGKETMPCA